MIIATDWKPMQRNSLQGFLTLHLEPSGISIRDCTFHLRDDGREWIGLPGKPQLDPDGCQRRDPTGKALYTTVVEIADKAARERFQAAALAAVHRMIGDQPVAPEPHQPRCGKVYRLPTRPRSGPPLPNDRVDDLWNSP